MVGEIAALCTALCWAVGARLFQQLGQSFTALNLNLWKGMVAMLTLLPLMIWVMPTPHWQTTDLWWLMLSGLIGIGLGDTFFFLALRRLGDSQSILVVETLAPIFTALAAMVWLSEWLTWQQWLAVGLIILSVDMVVKVQRGRRLQLHEFRHYLFAVGAALCQALGAVLSRDVLTRTGVDPANASFWRLLGGLAIIVLLILLRRERWLPNPVRDMRVWRLFLMATLLATCAALFLQMLALQHAKAALVQTLFATSVILSLLLAKLLGEKVNPKAFIWSVVACVGIALMLM